MALRYDITIILIPLLLLAVDATLLLPLRTITRYATYYAAKSALLMPLICDASARLYTRTRDACFRARHAILSQFFYYSPLCYYYAF